MASNTDQLTSPEVPQEKPRNSDNQQPEITEEETNNLAAILKRANCEANLGKWEKVLADAITVREIDPHSVDAWKLCARAALAADDVNSALDCLFEAMNVDNNDREAGTILQSVVEDNLNATLAVR